MFPGSPVLQRRTANITPPRFAFSASIPVCATQAVVSSRREARGCPSSPADACAPTRASIWERLRRLHEVFFGRHRRLRAAGARAIDETFVDHPSRTKTSPAGARSHARRVYSFPPLDRRRRAAEPRAPSWRGGGSKPHTGKGGIPASFPNEAPDVRNVSAARREGAGAPPPSRTTQWNANL